ncbi:MAG: NAD-dependent epimerase/dehydratase family protein [Actinobacteria bacterium]|nr:NAD-dependent epimerase/dehydratase family protein [Actinomycetota bacterium]
MRILVLGGTGWLGRRLAVEAIEVGHEVTCLARGTAAPAGAVAAGAALLRADRDRDDALAVAADSTWDAVVDVSSQPGQVRRAVRDLAPVAERYLYVSSCNAYASLAETGIDEEAELNAPLRSDTMASMEQYGEAKVACEQAVLAGFGAARTVIVRPGLIGGPGDRTGRSSYWPLRFAHPSNTAGLVIVPGTESSSHLGASVSEQPVSVIDVRDLASWMLRLLESGGSGVFNATGDPMPMREYLALAAAASGDRGRPVPVPSSRLTELGVEQWMGPRSLPLWIDAPEAAGIHRLSNARAHAAGLRLRTHGETLRDTLTWAAAEEIAVADGAGLSDTEERELLGLVTR